MRNYTIIIHCSIDSLSLSRSEVCRGEATAFLWPVGIGRNKKNKKRKGRFSHPPDKKKKMQNPN